MLYQFALIDISTWNDKAYREFLQFADELKSYQHSTVVGAQHPVKDGDYNTPMMELRKSSVHSVFFSAQKPGSPELNCCSVNGPKGINLYFLGGQFLNQRGVVVNFLLDKANFEIQTPKQILKIKSQTNKLSFIRKN